MKKIVVSYCCCYYYYYTTTTTTTVMHAQVKPSCSTHESSLTSLRAAHLPISCPLWAHLQPPNQTHNLMPAITKPLGNIFSGTGRATEEVPTKTLKIRGGGLSSEGLTINQNIVDTNMQKPPLKSRLTLGPEDHQRSYKRMYQL